LSTDIASAKTSPEISEYMAVKATKTKDVRSKFRTEPVFRPNIAAINNLKVLMSKIIGDPGIAAKIASSSLQPSTLLNEVGNNYVDGMIYSVKDHKNVSIFVTTSALVASYEKEIPTNYLPTLIKKYGRNMICNGSATIPLVTVTGIPTKDFDNIHAVISRSAQDNGPPHVSNMLVVIAQKSDRLYTIWSFKESIENNHKCDR